MQSKNGLTNKKDLGNLKDGSNRSIIKPINTRIKTH